MTGGVANNASREEPVYHEVKGGMTFATVTTEGGRSRGEEEEGGRGTAVWTVTTKATKDGVGQGAVGAPPSSALPPWRRSVRHLGAPAGDAVAGGDTRPLSRNGKGTSAAQ